MKEKIITIMVILFAIGVGFIWYGYHERMEREAALQKSMVSVAEEEITLNQVVPFAWDVVYTFAPYTSKEEIEAEIGFRSHAIREAYSEGILQLVFVKGKQVVAMVCDAPQYLGYDVVFDDKITHAENAVFSVVKEGKVVQLTRKE